MQTTEALQRIHDALLDADLILHGVVKEIMDEGAWDDLPAPIVNGLKIVKYDCNQFHILLHAIDTNVVYNHG